MADQRTLEVVIKAQDEASKVIQGVGSTLDSVSSQFKNIGSQMSSVGKGLTTSLTVPITAIGAVAVLAGNQFDDAMDKIIGKTGIAGDQIKDMEKTFKSVAKVSIQSFGEISDVMTGLVQRLGITGDQLETTSKQVLTFARINQVDASEAVTSLGRFLQSTGIDASDLGKYLDQLTVASQKSGVSVDNLAQMVADSGPAFKTLGFDVTESIALFANFEKMGARPEEVIMALTRSLSTLSKEGFTNAGDALDEYLKRIKDAPTDLEAVGIANDLFGARVGVKMAGQIRAGKFEIDGFIQSLQNSGGALQQASNDTMSFDEKMAMFRNTLMITLEPLGTTLLNTLSNLQPQFEILVGYLERAVNWFAQLDPNIQTGILAFFAFLAVIGPLLIIIGSLITAIGSIITGITAVVGIVGTVAGFITGILIPAIGALVAIIGGPVTLIILAIIALVGLFYLAWKNNWFGVRDLVDSVVKWFKETVVPGFQMAFLLIQSFITSLVDTWVERFNMVRGVIQGVVDVFNDLINKAKEAVSATAGKLKLPGFESGGFVPQTGVALLHRGEFVASTDMLEGRKSVPSSVEQVFNQPINIQANVDSGLDMNLLGDRVAFALRNSR